MASKRHLYHYEIHWILENSALSRVQIAQRLGVARKTVYEWEYKKTRCRLGMVERLAAAADVSTARIPAYIRQKAADAEQHDFNTADKSNTKKVATATTPTTATAPTTPTTATAPTTAPTATAPRPATPPRPANPVMEAAKAMNKYEVRFIPSYVSQGSRRSDGWYTLNAQGHMEYFKTKEEATAYAEAKRARNNADIAEFL
jgi:transcriptional regulator with XRE-family HTH domain